LRKSPKAVAAPATTATTEEKMCIMASARTSTPGGADWAVRTALSPSETRLTKTAVPKTATQVRERTIAQVNKPLNTASLGINIKT